MKNIFKKIIVPIISAALGCAVMLVAIKYSSGVRSLIVSEASGAATDDDPMVELKRYLGQRIENLKSPPMPLEQDFGSFFDKSVFQSSAQEISPREDDEYVYFDIMVDDIKSTSINASVENGYVTITGTQEKKSDGNESGAMVQSYFKSTFNRTFPLPEQVDANKMKMFSEKGKIVVRFPKQKV